MNTFQKITAFTLLMAVIVCFTLSCHFDKQSDGPAQLTIDADKAQVRNMPFFKFAALDGDPDSTNMNGNYATPTTFTVGDSAYRIVLKSVLISIEDTNITNSDEYGAITITNGVTMNLMDVDSTLITPLFPKAMLNVGDYSEVAYDINYVNLGAGLDHAVIRWTFGNNAGHDIALKPGQYIAVILNDDFTGLNSHQFFFQGYYENSYY